jgi:hypothetical protein
VRDSFERPLLTRLDGGREVLEPGGFNWNDYAKRIARLADSVWFSFTITNSRADWMLSARMQQLPLRMGPSLSRSTSWYFGRFGATGRAAPS